MHIHQEHSGLPHGTYYSYIIGFVLSIALTLIAFSYAPSFGTFTYPILIALAIAQLFVQLFFFLHLGRGKDKAKNATILAFTLVILLILVVGTLWIMQNLAGLHLAPPTTDQLYQGGVVAPQNELN